MGKQPVMIPMPGRPKKRLFIGMISLATLLFALALFLLAVVFLIPVLLVIGVIALLRII